MERPYMNDTGEEVRSLIQRHWDEFSELALLAYEVQFRSLISEEQKAAVVARLVELAVQTDRPCETRPGFAFPTTDISETRRQNLSQLDRVDWQEHGLLRISGYRVGKANGKPEGLRRRILNYIFLEDTLDDIDDPLYAQEWAAPMSSGRLQKLAETIAAFVRNAKKKKKKKTANMDQAIDDWENDLAYLKATFYDRWGDFPWPNVDVT